MTKATQGTYWVLGIAGLLLVILAGISYSNSISEDQLSLIINGNTESLTIIEEEIEEEEIVEAPKAQLPGIDTMFETYTNMSLGVQFSYPANWTLDTQSQTGVFTVRAVKNLGPIAYAAYDILLHNVEIHLDADSDLKTTIAGKDAYTLSYDECVTTQSIACVLRVARIPVEEGIISEDGIWKVKALEIRYGVYHDVDKKDLENAGISTAFGQDTNEYLGLYELFAGQEAVFDRMIEKTQYLK